MGSVTNSTFGIPLAQYSGSKAEPLVTFSGNTFQAPTALYTYGSLVEEFYDNTFSASGGVSTIVIEGSTLTEETTWQVVGTASRYLLDNHFTVGSETTLTITPGVDVRSGLHDSDRRIYDFTVDGILNATGASFSDYTDLSVSNGGVLNLTDVSISGGSRSYEDSWVTFSSGAMGTVTNSTFSIPLGQYSGSKAVPLVTFSGNTFQAPTALYTYGSLVEEFYDNTFSASGGVSTIVIEGGTLTEETTWQVVGTASRYHLNNNFTVGSETTLTITPGVDVRSGLYDSDRRIYDFTVDGILNATGASFSDYTDLSVSNGGVLDLTDVSISGGTRPYEDSWVTFSSGAMGTLRYSNFTIPLTISGNEDIRECDFSATHVTASDPADLRLNWWGSTDPGVIAQRFTGSVQFDPPLQAEPSEDLFYIVDLWPSQPISWRTHHIDLTFNRAVDESTLDFSDIELVGSNDHEYEVVYTARIDESTYRIVFDELLPAGTYNLTVTPTIRDMLGNEMDQDMDALFGEPFDDAFVAGISIDRSAPRVQFHVPGGDIAGTLDHVDLVFSEPIDPSSLGADDVVLTGPGGRVIATAGVSRLSDTRYRVSLPAQTDFGVYTITAGPNIADPAGNRLDQNDNGTAGEPGDVYSGTVNLADVDLEISNVSVNPTLTAGEPATVTWQGANATGMPLLGEWIDAVYLSADETWDIGDIRVAAVEHADGLSEGEIYDGSATFLVPGVLPGNEYHVIVRADWTDTEEEGADDEQDNVVVSDAIQIQVRELPPAPDVASGTLASDDSFEYYVAHLAPGENLRLDLNGFAASGTYNLYAGLGRVPSPQAFDYRAVGATPDKELVIPGSYDGGDCYILVHASRVDGADDYQLSGEAYEILLDRISPAYHGNTATASITLMGDGFNETTSVQLVGSDAGEWTPRKTTLVSPTELLIELDLPNASGGHPSEWPADVYDVRVANAGGADYAIEDAFEVYDGVGPNLEVNLVVPDRIGFHWAHTLWIEYENTGDAPMPAPMFVVQGAQDALMTVDPDQAGPGLWTDSPPDYLSDTVCAWAEGSGATPGTLQPGDSGRIPVYYRGLKQPWDFSRPPIEFSLGALTATEIEEIDWASMKDDARPEWIASAAWDVLWENFTTQTGEDWGDFVRRRSEILDYLHGLGQDTAGLTMDQVLAFAVALAADPGPSAYLAGAVDAATPAPGFALIFSRTFAAGLEARNTDGPLGRGWSHNWQFMVEELGSGDVIIRGPGGTVRYFSVGTGGTFEPLPGDFGTLTKTGNAYTLTEQSGTVTRFLENGQLDYVEDTNGNRITAGYDGSSRLVTLTHSSGAEVLVDYNEDGRVWHVTETNAEGEADDRTTTYTYDSTGELLETVTAHDGSATTYTYDATGGLATQYCLLSVEYADTRTVDFAYDEFGRLIETSANGGEAPIHYEYAGVGAVSVTDATGVETILRRGLSGQWSQVASTAANSTLRVTYDETGLPTQLTGPEGQLYRYTYDEDGNVTGVVDPLFGETTFTYETALDRLDTVTDAKDHAIDYDYDPAGNLTRITYEDGTHEDYTHDSAGNVLTWTNRRGQVVTYAYNASGQLTSKDYDTTPAYVDYEYAYNSVGNLTSSSYTTGEGTFATGYTYDPDTQRLTRIDYPGGQWFEFEYDPLGRRTRREDQLGNVENYTYDTAGRLDVMTDGDDTLIVDYDFDAAGRMSRKTVGNGVYTTYGYDAAGRLVDLGNYRSDNSLLSRFEYTYDASSRITSMTTTYGAGDPRTSGATAYGYDDLGQLTDVEYPDGRIVEYVYDAVGNRIEAIEDGVSTPYTTNDMNQYTDVGDVDYTFDADGNMTSKTEGGVTTMYTYNTENRLVLVAEGPTGGTPTDTWTYAYDAMGNRIGSTHNGVATMYVIDPVGYGNLAGKYDDAGDLVTGYSHGYGLLAQYDDAGSDSFYTFNAIGSTIDLTGAAGASLNAYGYEPHGTCLLSLETVSNDFRFAGESGVVTDSSGLGFMRSRYYEPTLGRFCSVDDYGIASGDVNFYTYAHSNPSLNIDPDGHAMLPAAWFSQKPTVGFTLAFLEAGRDLQTGEYYTGLSAAMEAGAYLTKEHFVLKGKVGAMAVGVDFSDEGYDIGLGIIRIASQRPTSNCGVAVAAPAPGGFEVNVDNVARYQSPKLTTDWTFGLYAGAKLEAILTGTEARDLMSGLQIWVAHLVRSADPNDKLTTGYGDGNFIAEDDAIDYTIRFENKSEATAPAKIITVTDTLSDDLDLDTFELTEIAFGDRFITVPSGLNAYTTTVDLRPDGIDCVAEIDVALDPATRELKSTFTALDPNTGWLPEDIMTGLLYPNDHTGRGEGHIGFRIEPVAGLSSGARIENEARIVFDYNEPIDTPLVANTIDAEAPTSAVDALPEDLGYVTGVNVSWSGQDESGGSGLAGYDVYYREDGSSEYTLWLENTTETSALFTAELGAEITVHFRSVAVDNVGHREPIPAGPSGDATVTFIQGIAGDLNEDFRIDSNDLDIVRSNWGRTVSPGSLIDGDPTGDGIVSASDLDVIRANWGQGMAAASSIAVSPMIGNLSTAASSDPAYGPVRKDDAGQPALSDAALENWDAARIAWAEALEALASKDRRTNNRKERRDAVDLVVAGMLD